MATGNDSSAGADNPAPQSLCDTTESIVPPLKNNDPVNSSLPSGPVPKSWADTPEAVIESLGGHLGCPHSILCCVLARAEAVVRLLSYELENDRDDQDDQDEILIHGLWDVLGNLTVAREMLKRVDPA